MPSTLTFEDLHRAGVGAYFRPRDVEPLGVTYYQLRQMVTDGQVEAVGHGLYRLAEPDLTEMETIAMVASAIPQGIVCLLSALRVHDIGTQSPWQVWMAIDRKARKPTRLPSSVRIVRFSGVMLTYGVDTMSMLGAPVRITSPARTVVDCFRYRNKVGLDVAMEALREAVRTRKAAVSEIDRAAEVCRVRTVIAPYLAALSV
ncbi:MAG: transcriptional regulator [Gemmatimonadetes bacterium]|jgi:predicted transcriptional regulator of viral defense system|nr:transcriptional regulator [Gemmatimonadota bacterium]MBK9408872.1 transcriptional regulator [Gemmatimonadota bacterium]